MARIFTTISLYICIACSCLPAWADLPFRQARYDSFRDLAVGPENIVFVGNSITNMQEWCEIFSNPLILNRGVSGAFSSEMLASLPDIVAGHPAKIFLMIGTNDLNADGNRALTPLYANIDSCLSLIRSRSPETEIYVQSILPNTRTPRLARRANNQIRKIAHRYGATYIDLWQPLIRVGKNDRHYTLDGLHLTAAGYRIWADIIAPYVGSPSILHPEFVDITGSLPGSYGMRTSYFGMLPVGSDDILFIGDDLVHGCEWHELLNNPLVKNRGNGWGRSAVSIPMIQKSLPAIFTGNDNKSTPSKIYLYVGANELLNGVEPDSLILAYQGLIDQVRQLAPSTQIYTLSLIPTLDDEINTLRIKPFNALLTRIPDTTPIDIYTPLLNSIDTAIDPNGYPTHLAYRAFAEAIALSD